MQWKTLQASQYNISAISVGTGGGRLLFRWSKEGVLCSVPCEWIMPASGGASAHQRWGLAVDTEECTFLIIAYEHFAKPFRSGIIVYIKGKSKPSTLALIPKLIEALIRAGFQGLCLMFKKKNQKNPNNFSLFWMALGFQVKTISASEMSGLSNNNLLNVPLKSLIELASIFIKWSSFFHLGAWLFESRENASTNRRIAS